jgi:hypothetical protein
VARRVRQTALEPSSVSAEEQVEDYQQDDEVYATAAIIADTWPHVVTAAAKCQ